MKLPHRVCDFPQPCTTCICEARVQTETSAFLFRLCVRALGDVSPNLVKQNLHKLKIPYCMNSFQMRRFRVRPLKMHDEEKFFFVRAVAMST